MCSVSFNTLNLKYNLSFSSNKKQNQLSPAEDVIRAFKEKELKDMKGSWYNKDGNPTASIPLLLPLVYTIYSVIKVKKIKKILPQKEFSKKNKQYIRDIILSFLAGCMGTYGLNSYFTSKTDENYKEICSKFNKMNTQTDAVLAEQPLNSNYIGGFCYPASGVIALSKMYVNDPIYKKKAEKILKHELVHARQYETVARSKDGIKKLNYAVLYNIKRVAQNDQDTRDSFEQTYRDIKNNFEKYKDVKIKLSPTVEVNLAKFIEASYILLTNPNAGIHDIPIVIDEKHYQKVIDKKGPLSPSEEARADLYYKAMIAYPQIGPMEVFNKNSSYYQNILEREAYATTM